MHFYKSLSSVVCNSLCVMLMYYSYLISSRCDADISRPVAYDYFVFAQFWPPGDCMEFESHCKIARNVTTWTVHGLWPNSAAGSDPEYCNKSWAFNITNVKNIEASLDQYWPNLEVNEPEQSLWSHEWSKHGTCATTLPALDGQYKYFNMGLQLNRKFNLTRMLSDHQIVPSNSKRYKAKDLVDAVQTTLSVDTIHLSCAVNKSGGDYVAQLEICLDKTFTPITCPPHHHHHHVPFWLRHKHQQLGEFQPCDGNKSVVWYKPIVHK